MDKNLEKMRKELKRLDLDVFELELIYDDLLKEASIQRFEIIRKKLIEIKRERNWLQEKYMHLLHSPQKNCFPPLWYLLKSGINNYDGEIYWICQCVECRKIKEDYPEQFKNVIYENKDLNRKEKREQYEEIKRKYEQLVNLSVYENDKIITLDKEVAAQFILKKYNNNSPKKL